MNVLSSTQGQGKENGVSGWAVPRLVRFAAFPARPHDLRQFVGQRDSGFVMPAELFQFDRPFLQAAKGFAGFRLAFGSHQSRPCPVDQQGAQVGTALFGDAAEETAVATVAFAWGDLCTLTPGIVPSRPLLLSRGVIPSHEANWRADWNCSGLPTAATRAVLVSSPMPGMVCRLATVSF